MEISKSDLIHIDNAIKTFKKGTYTLEGLEVMAFAETVIWLSRIKQQIQHEIQMVEWQAQHEAQQRAAAAQVMAATLPQPESFKLEEASEPAPEPTRKKKSKKS